MRPPAITSKTFLVIIVAWLLPSMVLGQSVESSGNPETSPSGNAPQVSDESIPSVEPTPAFSVKSEVPPHAAVEPSTISPPPFHGPNSSMMGVGGLMGNPHLGHMPVLTDYRVIWLPEQPVRGQPTDLWMLRQDISLIAPIWQD